MTSALGSPVLTLRRYGVSPGSHAHAHFQVLWGWRGTLELEIEGRGARVGAGRVAVVRPGARHDFWAGGQGGASCFVLDVDEPTLAPLAGDVLAAPPALSGLLQFVQAQPPGSASWRLAVPLLLQSLTVGPRANATPRATRERRIDWPALEAWVDARLHLPMSVAMLAQQVHLSPSQFAARCVAQWGVPPVAWVRERRLAMARRLKREGLAVSVVAQRCGYRSPSALTAAMRKSA